MIWSRLTSDTDTWPVVGKKIHFLAGEEDSLHIEQFTGTVEKIYWWETSAFSDDKPYDVLKIRIKEKDSLHLGSVIAWTHANE
jgi:hypothetical protein